jgi:PKD repeat protein
MATRRRYTGSVWGTIFILMTLTGQVHAHVALDSPNGGEILEVGSVAQIVWHESVNHGPATYDLWYSITGPTGPWFVIDSGLPLSGSANTTYDWVVPDTPSNEVRIRVLQNNSQDDDYSDVSFSDLAIATSGAVLQVVLEAEKDATIYEDGSGTNANGSGIYLFTGRAESQNSSFERRALLAFPIAEMIPEGSTITSVGLELTMSRTRSGGQPVGLHLLLENWSEGPSDPSGQEGDGATAVAGDVTWIHREFSGTLWTTSGASFAGSASATLQVASEGSYSYSSTPELVADVQGWLDDPSSNFGWALVVDSPPTGSAKRFNSWENSTASSRPKLTITYSADLEEPTADFSFTPAHPGPGEEVRFSDESTGEPTTWMWDFGDGQTSDEENPSHTYTTSGSKTVTLVASNASGSDSAVKVVRVGAPPPRRPSRRVAPSR